MLYCLCTFWVHNQQKSVIFCSISMFFCVYAFVNLDKYIFITFYLWSCKKRFFCLQAKLCKQSISHNQQSSIIFCYFIFLQLPLRFPSFFSCVQYKIRFELFFCVCVFWLIIVDLYVYVPMRQWRPGNCVKWMMAMVLWTQSIILYENGMVWHSLSSLLSNMYFKLSKCSEWE